MVLLTSAAHAQGHHVAAVVALCAVAAGFLRWLFLYLDDVLVQLRPTRAVRRQLLSSGVVGLLAVGVIAGAAVDAPGQVNKFFSHGETEQSESKSSGASRKPKDLRSRLTNVTDNGRLAFWSVSMDGFKKSPLHGTGAGTFEHEWDEKRSIDENVLDAHGLYPEVLGELGFDRAGTDRDLDPGDPDRHRSTRPRPPPSAVCDDLRRGLRAGSSRPASTGIGRCPS